MKNDQKNRPNDSINRSHFNYCIYEKIIMVAIVFHNSNMLL